MTDVTWIDGQSVSAAELTLAFSQKLDVGGDGSPLTVISNSSTNPRSLANRFTDTVNVLDYLIGQPDGTTDNTTAIQNALNAAAGVARVYFPKTTNSYRVSGLSLPSNSYLVIDGTILQNASSTTSVMYATSSQSNIVIDGQGTIDGNKSNQTSARGCVEITGATNVLITGLFLQNAFLWPVAINNSTYVLIDDCTFLTSNLAGQFNNGTTYAWVTNCIITGNTDSGFLFYGGVGFSGIIGCTLSGHSKHGITVFHDTTYSVSCHDILIQSNFSYTNGLWGISINKGTGAVGSHSNILIEGNRCYGNNTTNVAATGGITNTTGANVQIVNNMISRDGAGANSSYGINVGGSNTQVMNNQIVDEGQGGVAGVGIQLASTANNVLISGNQIIDDQGTPTMAYGINGVCGTNMRFVHNSISGMITAVNNATFASDTSGIDSNNSATMVVTGPFATSGAFADTSTVTVTPTTGFSNTIPNGCSTYLMTPAAALASGTVTMPGTPIAGQIVRIISSKAISAFTLSANVGQSIVNVPTSINGGTALSYMFIGTTWYNTTLSSADTSAAWMLEWTGGAIVANGTYYFTINTPYAGTILSMDYFTGSSTSFVANIEIAGSSVTSLSAVTVNSATQANTAATGANTFSAGQTVSVVITSATNNPTNAALNLRIAKAI